MASDAETVTITAECLCKAHTYATVIAVSNLPLLAAACHCNSCRHVTGALYSCGITWPGPRTNVDTSKLRSYAFSPTLNLLFCGACSTPLFFDDKNTPNDLGVVTGALRNHDFDLVKIVKHIFVEDTIDGGATMWLRKPNVDGSEAKRFKLGSKSEEYPRDWPSVSIFTGYEKKAYEAVPIRCKCKGVDLLLHRKNYEGKSKEELPWFIDPKTHKSIASFDPCDSCRLHSGIDIFHWTFTELVNIEQGDGKPFPSTTPELQAAVDAGEDNIGTLAYYKSSPDVQRYFCKVCSATVFYALDSRPEIVDVAIGLLDAPDGARAEGFLSWSLGGRSSWVDDTKGGWREGLMQRVESEAEEWRIERGYPKCWRRVEKEEKAMVEALAKTSIN